MTSIDSMYRHRATTERAIGRALVEMIERHGPQAIAGMLYDNGTVKGSDHGPRALILLSAVSRKRKSAALEALPTDAI